MFLVLEQLKIFARDQACFLKMNTKKAIPASKRLQSKNEPIGSRKIQRDESK